MKHIFILVILTAFVTGCVNLKTRSDLREGDAEPQRQTSRQQVKEFKEPKQVAAVAKAEELDEQMRQLNGRIDAVENHLNQVNASQAGEKQSVTEMAKYTDQKFVAYEEELKKLDAKVVALSEELERLKSAPPAASTPSGGGKGKTAYDEAEDQFGSKKWKEAIVNYQKYRDSYPKGKMYADATYKIGVCFQELKMKDEAKAFFDEVISKFPGSKEAKKAAFRMKSLK